MNKYIKVYLLLFLLIIGSFLISGYSGVYQKINSTEIGNKIQVIGELGFPLGEIIRIQGEVPAKLPKQSMAGEGKVFLNVTAVNDIQLKSPKLIRIDPLGIASIKKPEMNKTMKYIGYETGEFVGIPSQAFKYIPQATTSGYHFEIFFQILKEVE
ncbi:MAG: hypothetical protein WCV91_03020 [Candidatus Margulisiibacteriota bacterium]